MPETTLSDEGRAVRRRSQFKPHDYYRDKEIFYTGGRSSPYIWMRCPGGMGSWEFFDLLLEKAQIVGTPGEGFGSAGRGYFRITSFGKRSDTAEAAERLRALL
ncbi:MAG: hypothetical protein ACLUFM_03145 [Lachnospiraceae bacterium]